MKANEEASVILNLLKLADLGDPAQGRLEARSESITAPDVALARLREFGGTGWVCFTDEVVEVGRSNPLSGDGIPLSAELCRDDASVHLRQDGAGWRLITITKSEEGDQLIFTERRLKIGGGALVYEVAWKRESVPTTRELEEPTKREPEAWRPWCARLSAVEAEPLTGGR